MIIKSVALLFVSPSRAQISQSSIPNTPHPIPSKYYHGVLKIYAIMYA